MSDDFPRDWIEPYDLFISYARTDDAQRQVSAIAQEIEAGLEEFSPTQSLNVFFDKTRIVTGELWQAKLQRAIRQSKVMLAVLSQAYFESYWCRREYEEFVAVEKSRTYPGEALMPVYIIAPKDLDQEVTPESRKWFDDLNRLNGVELQDFWPKGEQFLQENDVRKRINDLRARAIERADYGRQLAKVPRRIRPRNPRFVGRVQELRQLRDSLCQFEIAAICAVQGIGGIGKSSLAREYAYCYRPEYLGGQFEVDLSAITTREQLEDEIIVLAKDKLGAQIDERTSHQRQLQSARNAFAQAAQSGPQHKILLILDNLNEGDVELVSALSQAESLPSIETTHIVVTTRAGEAQLGEMKAVTVDRLSASEALDVMLQYRDFERDEADDVYQTAINDQIEASELEDSIGDDEWKAALAIVNRLGRHTLAVAMVSAYLGARRDSITFASFLEDMRTHGIGLALDEVGKDTVVRQLIAHPQTLIGDLFAQTLEWLTEESPLPLRILEWASLLPPDTIPVMWLKTLVSSDEDMQEALQEKPFRGDPWAESLGVLESLQLLTGETSCQMHRVLQEVIRSRVESDRQQSRQTQVDQLIRQHAFAIADRGYLVPTDHQYILAMLAHSRIQSMNPVLALAMRALVSPLMTRGQLKQAADCAATAHEELERLASSDPENAAAQRDLSVSYSKLGDVCVAQGDLAGAKGYFEQSRDIRVGLAADPENAAAQRDLSVSYSKLGSVCVAQGDLAGAKGYFEAGLEIDERLAADPENAAAQRDLSVSYSKLGEVCGLRGSGGFGRGERLLRGWP